jgi:hypothetical protein
MVTGGVTGEDARRSTNKLEIHKVQEFAAHALGI